MKNFKCFLTAFALAVVLSGSAFAGGYRTRVTFSAGTYAVPNVALAAPVCTSGTCGMPALQAPFQAPLNYGAAGGCGVAPVQAPFQAPFQAPIQSAYGVQSFAAPLNYGVGVGAYGAGAFGVGGYGVNTFGFRSRNFSTFGGFGGYGVGVGVRTFGGFGGFNSFRGVGVRRGVSVQVSPFRGVRVIRFR